MDDMDDATSLTAMTEAEGRQLAACVAEAVSYALDGLPMACEFNRASGVFVLRAVILDGRVLH